LISLEEVESAIDNNQHRNLEGLMEPKLLLSLLWQMEANKTGCISFSSFVITLGKIKIGSKV
jgi:hypothetical protein